MVLETFGRMIINGYLLNLCNYKQFLYYLIQNNIKLKNFDEFAHKKTAKLCLHIENYIKENNVKIIYLNSGKLNGAIKIVEAAFSFTLNITENRAKKSLEQLANK